MTDHRSAFVTVPISLIADTRLSSLNKMVWIKMALIKEDIKEGHAHLALGGHIADVQPHIDKLLSLGWIQIHAGHYLLSSGIEYIHSHRKSKRKPEPILLPTLEQCILYFSQNGQDPKKGEEFFNHYHPHWIDKNNIKVKNWKLKAKNVWFIHNIPINSNKLVSLQHASGTVQTHFFDHLNL